VYTIYILINSTAINLLKNKCVLHEVELFLFFMFVKLGVLFILVDLLNFWLVLLLMGNFIIFL